MVLSVLGRRSEEFKRETAIWFSEPDSKTNYEDIKMKKSLVAAKPIEPSKELERFLGEPPLIGNERLEDYWAFSSRIERGAKPADEIARILVRDLVNIWWGI